MVLNKNRAHRRASVPAHGRDRPVCRDVFPTEAVHKRHCRDG
jgi:hypothetical protein